MATPLLSKHSLPGALGEILIDVRAAGRDSPRPAAIILHGFKGFKDWGMFPPLAERLARAGLTAVSFNMSGSGVDDTGEFSRLDRFGHNTYSAELQDVAAVVAALRAGRLGVVPPSRLGLVGHSRGGGVAVLYTARDPETRVLVTWAAISTAHRWPEQEAEWRAEGHIIIENARTGQQMPLYPDVLDDLQGQADALDIMRAAARITAPWLIVHGSGDTSVEVAEAQRLRSASGRPSTELLHIPGAGHTFGAVHPYKGQTPELTQALDATTAFLLKHLE